MTTITSMAKFRPRGSLLAAADPWHPTTAAAAMMLTAFQRYQIQPGPLLFENQGAPVWTLIASLYVGNLMLLVLNLPLVGILGYFMRRYGYPWCSCGARCSFPRTTP